ncbi:MAG: DNA primase [Bacillota bacterium]|nr:DNA primase [Bacillota bacterium]
MGPIPEEFVETVRNRIDIVELISEYVVLKRTGQNYVGLCPFHAEKTPSFTVSPAKQIFYCFGCGTGGNLFTFLMKKDHLTFPEAVEALAHRLGLAVPRSGEAREERDLKARYYELNGQAAAFYHKILEDEGEGERGRAYLKTRGVLPEAWVKFCLGYAPDTGTALMEFLEGRGYSRRALLEVGLIINRRGVDQDRFRGRIIFPIFDVQGRCLGFGGRALGEEQPKYLNSPESFIFSKGKNLYGLNLAIPGIREKGQVLVVEGYLDCIAVHQHGFLNTCAVLGTAFTRDQARLLMRYAFEVILAFDQDEAGIAAGLRGAGYLQELGARIFVLDLPSGKDPDEFLRSHGKEAFAVAIEKNTMSHLEFKLAQAIRRYNADTVFGKAEIVGALLEDLARIENFVVRDGYVRLISERLGITEDAVRTELFRYMSRERVRKDRNEKIRYTMEKGKQIFAIPDTSAAEAARRGLFRLMCSCREVWERVRQEVGFDVFEGKLTHYLHLFEQVGWMGPAELLGRVPEEDQAELAGLLLTGAEQDLDLQQQERIVEDYLRILKKERLNAQISASLAVLRERERNGDLEGIKDLMAELHGLYTKLEALKNTG